MKITEKITTDRQRVNIAIEVSARPCLPVSEEFFDEMLECLPPTFFGSTDVTGCYSIMQVGEATDHNQQGRPIYETYQRMNQEAVNQAIADHRMTVGQWYFVGLLEDINRRIKK